jgi:thioredoxin 1
MSTNFAIIIIFAMCVASINAFGARIARRTTRATTQLDSETPFKHQAGGKARVLGEDVGNYAPTGAMTAVSDHDFQSKVLDREGLQLVFFTSSWCAPCVRMMAAITSDIMVKHGTKANFYVCDTDLNPEVTSEFNIRSIPSTLLLKDGLVVSDIVGATDASIVSDQIIKFY